MKATEMLLLACKDDVAYGNFAVRLHIFECKTDKNLHNISNFLHTREEN